MRRVINILVEMTKFWAHEMHRKILGRLLKASRVTRGIMIVPSYGTITDFVALVTVRVPLLTWSIVNFRPDLKN